MRIYFDSAARRKNLRRGLLRNPHKLPLAPCSKLLCQSVSGSKLPSTARRRNLRRGFLRNPHKLPLAPCSKLLCQSVSGSKLPSTARRKIFAERRGFEPRKPFWSLHAFQACLFNHSSISPFAFGKSCLRMSRCNIKRTIASALRKTTLARSFSRLN